MNSKFKHLYKDYFDGGIFSSKYCPNEKETVFEISWKCINSVAWYCFLSQYNSVLIYTSHGIRILQ